MLIRDIFFLDLLVTVAWILANEQDDYIAIVDQYIAMVMQITRIENADGEFDFGNGLTYLDSAGSVAGDEHGYIYVADRGNKRIQKGTP